jgi:Domain of unknown function (DUF397)
VRPIGSNVAGPSWRKAQSSVGNGACVEVAVAQDMVAVRDSKHPSGPILQYAAPEWEAFLSAAKNGEFDNVHGIS